MIRVFNFGFLSEFSEEIIFDKSRLMKALLKKNYLLARRNIKMTMLYVLNPVVLLTLVFVFGLILPSQDEVNPPFTTTGQIRKCESHECYSIVFSPAMNEMSIEIMEFIMNNNNPPLTMTFDQNAHGDILGLESNFEMDDFILDNPNRTDIAVKFFFQGGNVHSYEVYYNNLLNDDVQKSADFMLSLSNAMSMKEGISNVDYRIKFQNLSTGVNLDSKNGLTLFIFCSLVFNLLLFTYQLFSEKRLRIRHVMRTMGLSDFTFWISWFITFSVINIVYTTILILVSYLMNLDRVVYTSLFVFTVLILLFNFCMISLSFFIYVVVTTSWGPTAASLYFILGIVSALTGFSNIYYWFIPGSNQYFLRYFFQLYPPFSFFKVMADIDTIFVSAYDGFDGPSRFLFTDLFLPINVTLATYRDTFFFTADPPIYSFYGLILNFLFTFFLAIYLENILPGIHLNHKPFYYICNPKYYLSKLNKYSLLDELDSDDIFDKPVLQVRNLSKYYKSSACCGNVLKAVDGVSFELREGQIICLLGQNGAGKSTTMNMLSGLLRPTAGRCLIYGQNANSEKARKLIGICPQVDILYKRLTVKEHMELYSHIKAIPEEEIDSEVSRILKMTNLDRFADKYVSSFSGGTRRRLSVALSILGGTRVLFLDEPTTGMDPKSCQDMWDIIAEIKEKIVVVLATHSMHEAVSLSDIVTILENGKLKCYGPSMELKKRYGSGYKLRLRIENHHEAIIEFILDRHPAEYYQNQNLYTFSFVDLQMEEMVHLFSEIQQAFSRVISLWGVTYAPMQEVFFNVTEDEIKSHSLI